MSLRTVDCFSVCGIFYVSYVGLLIDNDNSRLFLTIWFSLWWGLVFFGFFRYVCYFSSVKFTNPDFMDFLRQDKAICL